MIKNIRYDTQNKNRTNMGKQINELLSNIISKNSDWKFDLLKNWNTIVGTLKTRIRLEKIQNDILIIGVYESHWMQEIFVLSKVLLNTINKQFDEPKISQLRFKLVEEKHKKVIQQFTQQTKEFEMPNLTIAQQKALLCINDEQFKLALKNYLKRCLN